MPLTRKQAIRECKELWKEIEESGLDKYSFLRTEPGKKWEDKDYRLDCPLCDYSDQYGDEACYHCPLVLQYGKDCVSLGYGKYHSDPFFEAIRGLKE